MKRKDKEITDVDSVLQILNTCKVCRLAMSDEDGLYIVPLNFCFDFADEKLTLFFHSSNSGRKISALKKNPAVAFEMDCNHKLLELNQPCLYSYAYKSIIGCGTVSFINDIEIKKAVLSNFMKHQADMHFEFNDKQVNSVCIFKVESTKYSAKGL